jgi:hypothetical protein
MFTTAAPMTSEATVKTTVITPKRYPPGLPIAKVERLTLAGRQVLGSATCGEAERGLPVSYRGDKIDWSKSELDLVTKTMMADEVRIEVRASTEHPSFGRAAHYELSGELRLMVPSGWRTRFASEGSRSLPIPTNAGDSTILGTFQRTVACTYMPHALAPLPATPGPAPAP